MASQFRNGICIPEMEMEMEMGFGLGFGLGLGFGFGFGDGEEPLEVGGFAQVQGHPQVPKFPSPEPRTPKFPSPQIPEGARM
jgi:hypothetical protein